MSLDVSVIISMVDRLTNPVKQMTRKFNNQFKKINRSLAAFKKSMGKVLDKSKSLAKGLTVTAGIAGFAFKKLFLDTAAEFERYQIMLKSLEGSNDKAKTAMAWVSDFATRTPLQLNEIMQGYVKLRTFGIDPTNGSMQSLVDMNARMGGSNDTLQGMILAVGQAWTKQKLQGEEALQLIERGVPVWDLLAKATKLNVQQLQKLSQQGKLGRGAIKLLLNEIGKLAKGAADDQAKTWSGMTSMISDQWIRFANLVMGNGLFDWMKTQLSGLLAKLNDMAKTGKLKELATTLGTRLLSAFKTFKAVAFETWSVLKSVGQSVRWLHDLFGSWKPIIAGVAAVIVGPLVVALLGASQAVLGLGVALMTTPIGWFMLAVAALVGVVALVIKNWEPIKKFFSGLWDWIKQTFNTGIEWIKKILEYSPLGLMIKGISKLSHLFGSRSSNANTNQTPAPTLSAGAARTEVGGLIHIKVDGEGRPRVSQMASQGVDFTTETGLAFVNE